MDRDLRQKYIEAGFKEHHMGFFYFLLDNDNIVISRPSINEPGLWTVTLTDGEIDSLDSKRFLDPTQAFEMALNLIKSSN